MKKRKYMNFRLILNKQARAKKAMQLAKKISRLFKRGTNSTPVFIFGKQRSGTSMLLDIMRLHPDTEAFGEGSKISGFQNFKRLIENSKESFVCFKPLMDSHLIKDFMTQFPEGKFIWMYRGYKDNANSALRKFPGDTKKVKAAVSNQNETKWKWFYEGISSNTMEVLKNVYSSELSEFDLACLTWWVRNRICIELKDDLLQNLIFIKYEDLVNEPRETFQLLCERLGIRYINKAIRFIHNRSIGKNSYPELDSKVMALCDNLMKQLDTYYYK